MENFPVYNEAAAATAEYARLRVFLEARDAELAHHLTEEYERAARSGARGSELARALYTHFGAEWARQLQQRALYVYRAMPTERLAAPLAPQSVEVRAAQLSAAETRVRLLEELHRSDMRELAALIAEFRAAGLVSETRLDLILAQARDQCEPLREENRRLRALGGQDSVLQLALEDAESQAQDARDSANELRGLLSACEAERTECGLVRALNEQLLAGNAGGAETALLQARFLELVQEAQAHESRVETLERELARVTAQGRTQRASEAEGQERARLQRGQERLIGLLEARVEALEGQLEDERRTVLEQGAELAAADPGGTRALLEKRLREEAALFVAAQDTQREYAAAVDRTLASLAALLEQPVYGGAAGATLAGYVAEGRRFRVVDADAVERVETERQAQRVSAPLEDTGRLAELRRLAAGSTRLRLVLGDETGERVVEMLVDGVTQARGALVVNLARPLYITYVRMGVLPRGMVRALGQLRVTRDDGASSLYRYRLQGEGAVVVRFDDGAQLYATYLSPALYRLDLLVVPLAQ